MNNTINYFFKKFSYCLLFISITLLFSSCSDITGNYVPNFSNLSDTIKIKSNGDYERIFNSSDGKIIIDTGKWEKDGSSIDFHDWHNRQGLSDFDLNTTYIYGMVVKKKNKTIRLYIDFDQDFYYLRLH